MGGNQTLDDLSGGEILTTAWEIVQHFLAQQPDSAR
jgi:hypothetical protein